MGHRLERMVRLQVEDNKLTQEQIKLFTETFKIFDKDGSGAIDAQEFREVCETIGMTPTDTELELMMIAFDIFDTDGSGSLSYEEMSDVLMNLGQDMTQDKINALIKMADTDGNGEVDLQEFMAVCNGTLF